MGRKSIDARIFMGLGIAFAAIVLLAVALLRKPIGHAHVVHKAAGAHPMHNQSRISVWLADRARRKCEYARQAQREQERALELAKEQEQALHRQQAAERRAIARQPAKQEAEKEAAEKAARAAEKAQVAEAAKAAAKAAKAKQKTRKSWFSFRKTSVNTPAQEEKSRDKAFERDMERLDREMKEVEKLLKKR